MVTNLFKWLGVLLLMQQVATAETGLYAQFFNDGKFRRAVAAQVKPSFFPPQDNARDRLFNDGWLFHRGDVEGAEQEAFNDADWRSVRLPHDWGVEPISAAELKAANELQLTQGTWLYTDGDDADFAKVNCDTSGWKTVVLPRMMKNFKPDTYRWFRRDFELSGATASAGVTLELGIIHDCDELYVNGAKVGDTGVMPKNQPQGHCIPADTTAREYQVPAALLKTGKNLVAVCVYSERGVGGFSVPRSGKHGSGSAPEIVGPFYSAAIGGTHSGFTVGGTGWYRKHFDWKKDGRHATIRFGGVMMNSDVWLNGKHLGFHPYGYTSFYYDLTLYLKDGDNVLAVRARNEGVTSRWYPGSGVYRNVWLTTSAPTHVRPWGVWARTVQADSDNATLQVNTEIDGDITDTAIRLTLLDPDGREVARGESPAGGPKTTTQLNVKKPQLWNLDSPELYIARVELLQSGKVVDRFDQSFGIRTIRFTTEMGFELNGKSIDMLGGCVHHDNGLLGAVAPARADIRKLEIMKREGYNAVRTAHNPMSDSFYEACDRIGLLVLDEVFDVWSDHKTPQDYGGEAWEQGRATDIENWLRSTRNHPSIVIRSLGNEIGNRQKEGPDAVTRDLAELLKIARPFDNTRPYTGGTATISDRTDYMQHYDVQGYNYREEVALANHQKFPAWVMIGTESNPSEKAQLKTWSFVQEHPWFTGCFVWSAFEYIGESWSGWVGLNGEEVGWPSYAAGCGLIDITGFPKGGQYYRRVMAGASPIEINVLEPLHDGEKYARKGWSWPNEYPSWDWNGFEGRSLEVRVITRAPEVRLKLNGKEVGTRKTGRDRIDVVFNVPYQPGELVAEGVQDGKVVCSQKLVTPGKPAALRLVADRPEITADNNDLAYVSIEVEDANGRLVTQGRQPVRVSVAGDGTLEACGTGYHKDVYSFRNSDGMKTWHGRAMAIIRPNEKARIVTVTAWSATLGRAELHLVVKNPSGLTKED